MRTPAEFDEIRPYDPEEVPAVVDSLLTDEEFCAIIRQLMPQIPFDTLTAQLRQCPDALTIQKKFCYPLIKQNAAQCADSLSMDSAAITAEGQPYTFVSNHRDIVLDSAYLAVLLIDNGFGNTVEIAIGDNLLAKPWIKTFVRLNKSFIVQRGISMREILVSSQRLSKYIHYAATTKRENIWIAQREGRAKDSDDRTQDAILKMLTMGGEGSIVDRLKELHIVPTALSYEYDPCDWLKAQEFQTKRDNPNYKKTKQNDLDNMQTGIFGYKGNVRFTTAPCINDWLDSLPADMPKTEIYTRIAQHIDREIHRNYTLYPGNFVAADLLLERHPQSATAEKARNIVEQLRTNPLPTTASLTVDKDAAAPFSRNYTAENRARFENYIQKQLEKIVQPDADFTFLEERILTMYANPMLNHISALIHEEA